MPKTTYRAEGRVRDDWWKTLVPACPTRAEAEHSLESWAWDNNAILTPGEFRIVEIVERVL